MTAACQPPPRKRKRSAARLETLVVTAPIAGDVDNINRLLLELSADGFYGDVVISMAGGKFTEAKEQRVWKPRELGE